MDMLVSPVSTRSWTSRPRAVHGKLQWYDTVTATHCGARNRRNGINHECCIGRKRVIRLQRCLCFPLPTPSFPSDTRQSGSAPPFSHARWWLCVRWLCVRRELCCDPIMCDRGLLAAIRRNRNRSLHERAKDCMQLLDGTELHSQADVDVSQLRTIQSQRKRIFNFGLFKSGSTSLQLAISWSGHGDASCKTAWDVRTAKSSWDLSAVARFIRHHASEHGRLDMSIVPDSSMLLQALDHCTALQDAS